MNTLFNRLALVAAFTGCLSLAACDEAENDPLATPADADAARDAKRPGDAHHADGARPGDPVRTGGGMVDGHPGGANVDGKEPDNTAHNKGDGEGVATKTPFDQSNAQEDIKVTADIRKAILGMEGMSTNADNVKVITSADGVAIRGVVESQSEIDAITKIVQQNAGTRKTDIHLSVDPD